MDMPAEIGVCAFVDGTLEAYRDSIDVAPSTKYRRADLDNEVIRELAEALEECQRLLRNETEYGEAGLAKQVLTKHAQRIKEA